MYILNTYLAAELYIYLIIYVTEEIFLQFSVALNWNLNKIYYMVSVKTIKFTFFTNWSLIWDM